jgi:hypothetical protein
VAFAARCARRVLPAFTYYWPDAPAEHAAAVRRAVEAAEHGDQAEAAAADAFAAATATDGPAAAVAYAASDAALAAALATDAYAATAAAGGLRTAADLLLRLATVGTVWQLRTLRRDFDRLTRRVAAEGWTDDTPVPPAVFGPLWPDSRTPEWAKASS